MGKRNVYIVLAVCAVVGLFVPSAVAGPALQNGNFSAGLAGWSVDYGDVADGGGFALFQEDDWDLSSTLSQPFTLPAQAEFLCFDLTMTAQGELDASLWPDAFTASLLDGGTLDPLVSWDPLDPFVTEFFLLENTGATETAAGVSVAGDTVSLDVSPWAGQDVFLSFDLWASYDGMTTSVELDNVEVTGGACIIPAPAALALGLIGSVLAVLQRRVRA